MLKIVNGKIVDSHNNPVKLRGICLGGWLMMEGYMLGGKNIPEHKFKAQLAKLYGKKFAADFSVQFRENFITPKDFAQIKKLGFNCVRLPFNYRLLEESSGFQYLEKIVKEIARHKLWVILDMHAMPGSQNCDWHSDSCGKAKFWEDKKCRRKYLSLWKKLALAFKNNKTIAGYDIMNEPVTDKVDLLKSVYQETINIIRGVGDEHIIFLEGNYWGQRIDFLEGIKGANLAISVHFYDPFHFTFNLLPDTQYPGKILGEKWNRQRMEKFLKAYARLGRRLKMPVYAGEFGVASRCACCGSEFGWVEEVLAVFTKLDFHFTYWTYKSVRGMNCPDGLFQLTDASGIINSSLSNSRTGFENFYVIFGSRVAEFYQLIRTTNFKMNKFLYGKLKPYLKPAL